MVETRPSCIDAKNLTPTAESDRTFMANHLRTRRCDSGHEKRLWHTFRGAGVARVATEMKPYGRTMAVM